MTLLFTYGSVRQGFCNQHGNSGESVPGRYRTRRRMPFYLMGMGTCPA